jgi:SAM-dependent methyltransferase
MRGYYTGKLSGERLRQCYDIASPRVKQYLEAEIRFVLGRLDRDDLVLELGCGYGRVALRLAAAARCVVGIDTSTESLALARRLAGPASRCEFAEMDALDLAFPDSTFDDVVCVQNGICAFGVDQEALLREAVRVTRPGGRVLFSSYAERFWPERLEWFESQAALGLVGAIDHERTGSGTIVCEDGFHARMVSPQEFRRLGERLGVEPEVTEVDGSSVFCELALPQSP